MPSHLKFHCQIQHILSGKIVKEVTAHFALSKDSYSMLECELEEECKKFGSSFIDSYIPQELRKTPDGEEIYKTRGEHRLLFNEPEFINLH